MSILVYHNSRIAGAAASTVVASEVISAPKSVIGLDAADELIPVYSSLQRMTTDGLLDWSEVSCYALSEHVRSDAEETISAKMHRRLFDGINLAADGIHEPESDTKNWSTACSSYEDEIMGAGGFDLVVVAIGQDGSIAFNVGAAELAPVTHVERTSQGRVVTVGISTIMSARKIVAYMVGEDKASIAPQVIHGPVTPQIPATYLQLHGNTVFILDEEAAAAL